MMTSPLVTNVASNKHICNNNKNLNNY